MTSMKLPPSKTSPLVDDDLDEEEAIKVTENKNLENNFEDETLEIDKIINIKESKNHPLENVKENLNKKTLRSIREAFGGYTRDLGLIWGRNGTRLQLYNEVVSRYAHRVWRQRRNFLATPLEPSRDDVKKCVMASERNRLKRNPRSFGEATTSKILRHLGKDLKDILFVDYVALVWIPESACSADRAQSPRVPVPFPEDPYEAIRQTYLVETETPESPYIEASATPLLDSTPPTRHAEDSMDFDTSGARPTSLDFTTPLSPDHPLTHTTPTLVSFLRKTACMVVRVLPAIHMALCHDEGLAAEDEGPATGDEGLAAGDEGPGMRVESLGLGGDQAVPEGQQQATPVVRDIHGVNIDVPFTPPPTTPCSDTPSPDWFLLFTSCFSSTFKRSFTIHTPMIPLTGFHAPVNFTPLRREAEGSLTELGAQFERCKKVRELLPNMRFRSLEHEQERVAMTFGAIWRRVLALESWTGQTDAQRATLWHVISDT
ncbi:hypothetical protein Tco_1214517 [Tanacetum coccineum]